MKVSGVVTLLLFWMGITVHATQVMYPRGPQFDLIEVEVREFTSAIERYMSADTVSKRDLDSIAGSINRFLVKDNRTQYLDWALKLVDATNLVPWGAVFIITHNTTLRIAEQVVKFALPFLAKTNYTMLFNALDDSGLFYSIIAGTIEDSRFFPSLKQVVSKLLLSGILKKRDILEAAGRDTTELYARDLLPPISSHELQARALAESQFLSDYYSPVKRNNVEDLLTTIFGSVSRSNIVPDTVNTLLANTKFQDFAVTLLKASFSKIGSLVTSFNLSAITPIISALFDSGILVHTLERALKDTLLHQALINSIGALIKRGDLTMDELLDPNYMKREDTLASSSFSTVAIETASAVNITTETTVASVSLSLGGYKPAAGWFGRAVLYLGPIMLL